MNRWHTNVLIVPWIRSTRRGACDDALSYEEEEILMVQQGTIEFKFEGEVHPLYKGDCLYFESHVSHRIINAQKQEATVLCVLFEPGH